MSAAGWFWRTMIGLVVSAVGVAVCAGCTASPSVDVGGAGAAATTGSSAQPSVQPTLDDDGPWPHARPTDLEVAFGQDGGMAPWSEDIDIVGDRASYVVWMDGMEYTINYTPADERLDALYRELTSGRFDLYEAIPFEDDEIIYDAEQESWAVRFGEFRHRVSIGGNDIARPDRPGAPLAAMSGFNDVDAVPGADIRVRLLIDEAATQAGLWDIDVSLDLGDVDLAVGDDRWTDTFELYLTAPAAEVPVRMVRSVDDELVLYEGTHDLADGTDLLLTVDADGSPTIEVSG